MLSRPAFVTPALALAGALLTAWLIKDNGQRLVLWGLLLWLLIESTEAVRHWKVHPWRQRAADLSLYALVGLLQLFGLALAGFGALVFYRALHDGKGIEIAGLGAVIVILAIFMIWLGFKEVQHLRPNRGGGSSYE
jgi:hypothetical protein